jgi:diguanylate cyclase (GGDEF)-like protein
VDSLQLGASAIAAISAAMALALAWLAWHFAQRRDVPALRDVAVAWIALGVAAMVRPLEVIALEGPLAILLDAAVTFPAFVHLGFLVLGATSLLQEASTSDARRREVLLGAVLATVMTVAISLLVVAGGDRQVAVRIGVRAAATALACVGVARVVMRAPGGDTGGAPSFGAGIVRGALLVAGAAAAWQAGTAIIASRGAPLSAFWAMVGFVEFVAQCGVAVGLVVWILDREVARASAMAASAEHRAATDPLTGLPNRTRLMDRVHMALAAARRDNEFVAVLYADLDGFKQVNDVHGHAAGDAVLRHVAHRLVAALRAPDTVGRIGGDEFVIVTPRLRTREDVPVVVARIRQALRGDVTVGDTVIPIDGSVGCALFPDDGADADFLLAAADDALYRDKTLRRGERWARLAARSA